MRGQGKDGLVARFFTRADDDLPACDDMYPRVGPGQYTPTRLRPASWDTRLVTENRICLGRVPYFRKTIESEDSTCRADH